MVRRRPALTGARAAGPGPLAGPRPGRLTRLGRRVRRLAVGGLAAIVLVTAASVTGVLPVQLVRVDARSMVPTLHDGDLVVVTRWVDDPARDTVVVAEVADQALVKRVVGVGGDRVSIEDGVLVVDGSPSCAPVPDGSAMDGVWFGPVDVPAGEVFLLGDNRAASVDSRVFGTVPLSAVVGVVEGRVWPSPGAPAASC